MLWMPTCWSKTLHRPWSQLGCWKDLGRTSVLDLLGPMPTGECMLLLVEQWWKFINLLNYFGSDHRVSRYTQDRQRIQPSISRDGRVSEGNGNHAHVNHALMAKSERKERQNRSLQLQLWELPMPGRNIGNQNFLLEYPPRNTHQRGRVR